MTKEKLLEEINLFTKFLDEVREIKSFCQNNKDKILELILPSVVGERKDDISKDFLYSLLEDSHIDKGYKAILEIKSDIEVSRGQFSTQFCSFTSKQLKEQLDYEKSWNYQCSDFLRDREKIKNILSNNPEDIPEELRNKIVEFFTNINSFFPAVNTQLIKIFNTIKETKKNIIMIGPNGCGKSTFARSLSGKLELGATVIPAQKTFVYEPNNWIPKIDSFNKTMQYLTSEKSGKHWRGNDSLTQLNFLISHLIHEYNQHVAEEHEENLEKRPSMLKRIIDIWNEIILHRNLKYDYRAQNLHALDTDSNSDYTFMNLSDGEKTVFYYIAMSMLAPPETYIIVDEPENHLNLAIVNQIWDKIERERKDCQFIYLTHNPEFAAGRKNASILWIKNISPVNLEREWEYEEVPSMEEIDKRLIIELLGSRRPIIFCEGKKDGLDYAVYSSLFPEFSIVPVGGCKEVISHVRVYNKSKLFQTPSIGMIDGDFHSDDEKMSLKEKSVYCLALPEIENLLCDETLLEYASERFSPGNLQAKKSVQDKLFVLLEAKKEEFATSYANHKARLRMNEELPNEKKSYSQLIEQYNNFRSLRISAIDAFYNERKSAIESALKEEDFEKSLALFTSKSVIATCNTISGDYKANIIAALGEVEELRNKLIDKYFTEVVAFMQKLKQETEDKN